MKIALINEYKDKFKQRLVQTHAYDEQYKYESLLNFKNNWDLDVLELEDMYNKSFQSSISGRLWGGSKESAKDMMVRMIKHNREFMRSAFRDLFADYKDLGLRINRFIEHCDEILSQLKTTDKTAVDHHHDYRIVSLYLAFDKPMEYCIYDYPDYKRMMMRLEAKSVPLEFEIEKFFKLTKTINTIISKDEELIKIYKSQIKGEKFYQDDSLLLVHDYIAICSKI